MILVRRLFGDKAGATAIEYGLIAALIAVALIGSLMLVTGGISNAFNTITNKVSAP